MEVFFVKKPYGVLAPCYSTDMDSMAKIKNGSVVRGEITMPRDIKLHRRFFKLLSVGYEYWEPPHYLDRQVEKNPERFRKDLTMLCGRSHMVARLDGSVMAEADSISFANMPQDQFDDLYDAAVRVLHRQVMTHWSIQDILVAVDQIESFAR